MCYIFPLVTIEKEIPRDIVFKPKDLLARLMIVWNLDLYQGSNTQYAKAVKELDDDRIREKAIKKEAADSKKRIKKEIKNVGKKILSDKNTITEFIIENQDDIDLSDLNIREAFTGRIKKKRKYEPVEKDDDIYFKPIKGVKNVGLVSIVRDLHKIKVSVYKDGAEVVSTTDREKDLLFGRVTNFLNHTTRLDKITPSKIEEINIKNLYFLGQLDSFKFTTENFVRLNRDWAKKGGYFFINPNDPAVRVAPRYRSHPRVGKIPLGRTVLEGARIQTATETWTITAVQDPGVLPRRSKPVTNFFIIPSIPIDKDLPGPQTSQGNI